MSLASISCEYGRLECRDVCDLFGIEFVRDDFSAGFRVWVIADHDGRTLDVSDLISMKVFLAGAHDSNFIRDALARTIDELVFLMLDRIVSTGWRILAEPLGLKQTAMGEQK